MGLAGIQPLEGCGELGLGMSLVQGTCTQSCVVVVGTAWPRCHPALGWSLACREGGRLQPWWRGNSQETDKI